MYQLCLMSQWKWEFLYLLLNTTKVPWDQACEWIKEAVKPLGQAYSDLINTALTERWIDKLKKWISFF